MPRECSVVETHLPGLTARTPASRSRSTAPTTRRACRTVLVVDDDRDVRDVMTQFLRLEGYAVATAANGLEALEHLRSGDAPCLILLDVMMPEMDGVRFRLEQKKDPRLSGIPVVVVSALRDVRSTAAASHLDAVEYLEKPVDFDSLLVSVLRHCP
jgi:chemosensory pili system protein ChpA (sensor histidine kinase/response regulator)